MIEAVYVDLEAQWADVIGAQAPEATNGGCPGIRPTT